MSASRFGVHDDVGDFRHLQAQTLLELAGGLMRASQGRGGAHLNGDEEHDPGVGGEQADVARRRPGGAHLNCDEEPD